VAIARSGFFVDGGRCVWLDVRAIWLNCGQASGEILLGSGASGAPPNGQ